MGQGFADTLEGLNILLNQAVIRLSDLDRYNVNYLYNEKVLHDIEYNFKVARRKLTHLQSEVAKDVKKEYE